VKIGFIGLGHMGAGMRRALRPAMSARVQPDADES